MCRIIFNCVDVEFPTIMPSVNTSYYLSYFASPRGPMLTIKDAQRLYQSLKLRSQWESMVTDFYRANMANQPVIGVHVRHGNGEGLYRDHFKKREITDLNTFVALISDKIKRCASRRFRDAYTVFLCTDSDDVVSAMEPNFPSFVSRRIWRPKPGEGVDFDQAFTRPDNGVGAAADALIDMQLLAKCDVVLITRFTAFASHVRYIMEKPGAEFFDHNQMARL